MRGYTRNVRRWLKPVLTEDDEGVLVGAAKSSNCLSGVV